MFLYVTVLFSEINLIRMDRIIDTYQRVALRDFRPILLDNPFFKRLPVSPVEVLARQSLGAVSMEYIVNWLWTVHYQFNDVMIWEDFQRDLHAVDKTYFVGKEEV